MNQNPTMNQASENISQILNPKPTEKEIREQRDKEILEDIFQ